MVLNKRSSVRTPPGSTPVRGRRTYRLTRLGRVLLEAEARRLDKALALVRSRPLAGDVKADVDAAS